MSRPCVRGALITAAALTLLALSPAAASAASVTLSSPADGAVFYGPGAVIDAAPLIASRDVSGCANPPNAFWRVYRIDSTGSTLPVAQSTEATINIQRLWLFSPGVYRIYGEFLCAQSNGTTTPIRSDTHTITIVSGNPPPPGGGGGGGGSDPAASAKAAYCASQKAHANAIVRAAKEIGEGKGVQDMETLGSAFFAISNILEPVGKRMVASANPVVAAYGTSALFVAESYETYSNVLDLAVLESKNDARKVIHDYYTPLTGNYYTDCGEALLAVDIKPQDPSQQLFSLIKHLKELKGGASSSMVEIAARKRKRRAALGKRFKASARAFKSAVTAYNQAQATLERHLSSRPAAEVSAVRQAASRLVAVTKGQAKLRRALPRALLRIKARKSYFPKKLRSNEVVKALNGLSVAQIIKRTQLASHEQGLVDYLRKQPVLPSG
jgi:hypothetical protein